MAATVPAAAYLSLNITLLFTAVNPNKVGIRYGATAFDVMYHGVPLGVAAVPGFEQPAHSTRLLTTRVIVDRFNVLQADAQDLVRDAAINDRVDLRITGDVAAKILVLGFSSPKVQVLSRLRQRRCGVGTNELGRAAVWVGWSQLFTAVVVDWWGLGEREHWWWRWWR
uniref:Late embryogenesis abundant protein LEA-2 subgroup domain-containing protein n=1 Tax=Oryza brachyantha TaxID=4533 RepID=J3LM86_ORYBR